MCCGLVFRCTFYAVALGSLFVGLVVLTLGSVYAAQLDDYLKDIFKLTTNGLDDDYFVTAVYLLLPVGTLLAISFICGCCGAKRSGACCGCNGSLCLFAFIISALITVACVVVAAVLSTLYKDSLDTNELLVDFNHQVTNEYALDAEITDSWDKMQSELKCCGAEDFKDYDDSYFQNSTRYNNETVYIPETCCSEYGSRNYERQVDYPECNDAAMNGDSGQGLYHTKGCVWAIEDMVNQDSNIVSGICYAFGILNFAGIILACCIRNKLEEE